MPLDTGFIGRVYPATQPYVVSRAKIAEFADAVGDDSPAYRDVEAAAVLGYPDVIAPPTFATIVTLEAAYAVVHYVYDRPLRAGDEITVVVTVESIRSMAGNDMIVLRGDVATVQGEHALTSYTLLVARSAADSV
jgi:acyl dehydratase